MRAFIVLTRLRLLEVLRSASSTGFLLALPIVLLLIVGFVFWNGHPFERRHVSLVAATLAADEVAHIEQTLRDVEEVRIDVEPDRHAALGKLRSRMASAVLLRDATTHELSLLVGPRDVLFGRGLAGTLSIPVKLEVLSVPRFGYVHFLFPGVLSFSVLVAGLFGMGYAMVRYRQSLFLKKLATTQLPRFTFVASQITARTLLVLLQSALLVLGARLLFDLPLSWPAAAWLTLITTLGLLAFMGIGFALACAVRDEATMVDVISMLNIPLVFLSELFFLLDELPKPLALVGNVLPTTHMVRLVRQVLLYGVENASALAPSLALLALWMLAAFALSLRAFRWHS